MILKFISRLTLFVGLSIASFAQASTITLTNHSEQDITNFSLPGNITVGPIKQGQTFTIPEKLCAQLTNKIGPVVVTCDNKAYWCYNLVTFSPDLKNIEIGTLIPYQSPGIAMCTIE